MYTKKSSIEIKDISEKGIVEAYANVYDNEDSDGDISAKGSFVKTVKENRKRIRVLKDHNPTITLGVPLEIDAKDSYGLRTITQFNLQKEVARDMFTDIKLMTENNLNAELSIGYNVISRGQKDKRVINEYKLHEYSFLSSWAANELSTVQGFKGVQSYYGILEMIQKAYNLPYSDTRLKQFEQILKSLTNSEPSKDTYEQEADAKKIVKALSNFKY
jgi:HK97 family phage prohead protease